MKTVLTLITLAPGLLLAKPSASNDGTTAIIENSKLKRVITTDGSVGTASILNKLDGKSLTPTNAHAFVITLKDGSEITPASFKTQSVTPQNSEENSTLTIKLSSAKPALDATIVYTLGSKKNYTQKTLTISPKADLEIAKIDLESLDLTQAYQPYTISQITSQGGAKWRPGLGQPLYTKETGTYWGLEYPASINSVKDGKLSCSYLVGKTIKAGENYTTHSSVLGVADSPEFTKQAFFDYIDQTRIRPLRLQTQYNSWFNQGKKVDAKPFIAAIEKVSKELNTTRGVPALSAYVIDDGWQDPRDWSENVWKVNKKFDPAFKNSNAAAKAAKSNLGIWLAPGCTFGGQPAIPDMRKAGFKTLDPWMSLAHPLYMDKLTTRLEELTKMEISYFKLDGLFGHLRTRNFDIEGFKGSEKELNDAKYDLQKIQYLTDGSDLLINAFQKMHSINPDVYIVISNGAWLSPWWLHHIDAVWMINAGDAAGGSDRTAELVYRDKVYHDLAITENTQFPLHSIFNHEPKKTTSEETKKAFRDYLYMNMSRGTGFIELYIKPNVLKPYDWDVLAEGMLWAHKAFPTFKHSQMHGGSPQKNEVYGYTAWLDDQGYVSLHNPSDTEQSYSFTLDRKFGLTKASAGTSYLLSSPLADSVKGLESSYTHGDTISLKLKPKEIRILNFSTEKLDWSKLIALQTRTDDDHKVTVTKELENHPVIGIWAYNEHTREFKKDGTCTLRKAQDEIWTKPFEVKDDKTVIVGGKHIHAVQKDGSLKIEGKHTAKRIGNQNKQNN